MEEEAEKQRQEEKMKRDVGNKWDVTIQAEKKKEEERKAKEVEMRAQAKAEKEEGKEWALVTVVEERLAKEAEEAEAVEEIVVGEVPALEGR